MAALGFNVTAHRIAAYAFAALIAAIAGVLLVWHGGQISPGTAGVGPVIDILIIAVVGGLEPADRAVHRRAHLRHPAHLRARRRWMAVGLDGKRFQLLIGLGFLLIVLFSPDGVLGLWARWRARLHARRMRDLRRGTEDVLMPTSVAERLSAAGTANALELRGVTRLFGALAALTDVTLTVRPGERRAVLGSNGAGKTTLFNCITGDFPLDLRHHPLLRRGRDAFPAA